MLPLHTDQLIKLHYKPTDFTDTAMTSNIHQHGQGDNFAGDKVMRDKIGTQISSSNIANVVNENKDNAQVTASHFSQTTGASPEELLQLIAALRQNLAQFPAEHQEDIEIDLEDVEAEIHKPAEQRNLSRLKKRLIALGSAALLVSSQAPSVVEQTSAFIDNVTELSTKVGIELPLPPAAHQP